MARIFFIFKLLDLKTNFVGKVMIQLISLSDNNDSVKIRQFKKKKYAKGLLTNF